MLCLCLNLLIVNLSITEHQADKVILKNKIKKYKTVLKSPIELVRVIVLFVTTLLY